VQRGELKGEDGDAAGTEDQQGLARLDLAQLDHDVPGGERRAGQGGGLLVGEVLGDRQHAVLREDRVLAEQAVDRAAQGARHGLGGDAARGPALEKAADDAVARVEAGYARADLDHLARPVRVGDARIDDAPGRRVQDVQEVAVVDRVGAQTDQHLSWARARIGSLGQMQSVDALG
jgi:hypothetical protein